MRNLNIDCCLRRNTQLIVIVLLILSSLLNIFQTYYISSHFSYSSSLTSTHETRSPPPQLPAYGLIRRHFHPHGLAAYSFILMSAYRTSSSSFSIIGLSSTTLHRRTRPSYRCQWVPHDTTLPTTTGLGEMTLPSWGYGGIYTDIVITCRYPVPTLGHGNLLLLTTSNGADRAINRTDVLDIPFHESKNLNNSVLKYDYLYCGSPLFGDLSPQRIREWIAYHVRLFGTRSHFVLYDAGGVHEAVLEVLRPWMELGYVTLHDIRGQERFDGYYHNQFMVINDCLHRYKFEAGWIFFFDVDEFLFIRNNKTIESVTTTLANFSQFTFGQMPMSSRICMERDREISEKMWGFEKLVYRDVERVKSRNRKYAVQPQFISAIGVHISQNLVGKTSHDTSSLLQYFHYHGTINNRQDPCQEFTNDTSITIDETQYMLDTTMRSFAPIIKQFERETIDLRL